MRHLKTDVAILGAGAAGTALAHVLARDSGVGITVVYRHETEGSSFTNQKWKHSGALYPVRDLARTAWHAYQALDLYGERRYLLGPQEAQFCSDDPQILEGLESDWRAWGVADWGLQIERIRPPGVGVIGQFGRSVFCGGFRTPDCVIDYPSMITDLRHQFASSGILSCKTTTVRQLIRSGDRLSGVLLATEDGETMLHCRHCIVTMGAWSIPLLASIGVSPPVKLTKCNVLAFEGELVDRITTWIRHEVTIVPYRGTTLVADARFRVVTDPDNLVPHGDDAETLLHDLRSCFPDWNAGALSIRGCIKTAEVTANGTPNPNIVIYTDELPDHYRHGVRGLTVAFPGKASFMWTIAQRVADSVRSKLLNE